LQHRRAVSFHLDSRAIFTTVTVTAQSEEKGELHSKCDEYFFQQDKMHRSIGSKAVDHIIDHHHHFIIQ